MTKTTIGIVGEIGAGKTIITDYLKRKHGAVSFRFSDMLRDILKRLYLPINRPNFQLLSRILRENFGQDLMSKVIADDVNAASHKLIITDGIRRIADTPYLKKLPNFYIMAVTADPHVRFERLNQRKDNADDQSKTWEQFQKEAQAETEVTIREIAAQADFTIDNSGTLKELYSEIDKIMRKIIT